MIFLPIFAAADIEINFIIIGQGDAAIITCDDESMIIDGGPGAETYLMYTIVHNKLEHVKYLIATHYHENHAFP